MASISQPACTQALPDFRNLGAIARVLVGAHALAAGAILAAATSWSEALEQSVALAMLFEPALLSSLAVLWLAAPALARVGVAAATVAVLATVLAVTALVHTFASALGWQVPGLGRTLALAAAAAVTLLWHFRLRARALAPALAEARLQALQARIGPHFLFNSLNAVLALVRRDPARAERALEDLAELYRDLMREARRMVRLADELDLLERYAAIEQLRLGERLRIVWDLDRAPAEALVPPLVLQPLLENAIRHGVEPSTGPAEVSVTVGLEGGRVVARVENALAAAAPQPGNRLALENVRERLALFFDAEAELEAGVADGRYRVTVRMPHRRQAPPAQP